MSKTVYLLVAIAVILFGTYNNYTLISPKGSSGSRGYVPGGGGGGFSGGHK